MRARWIPLRDERNGHNVAVSRSGVTGIFDPKTKGFVALADGEGGLPAGAANALNTLQGFTPSTYFAVTVH